MAPDLAQKQLKRVGGTRKLAGLEIELILGGVGLAGFLDQRLNVRGFQIGLNRCSFPSLGLAAALSRNAKQRLSMS
jgi:hypothetical protein